MSLSINNHYVPQFYLRFWSDNGTHIWLYRKLVSSVNVSLWKHQAISGTAFEKHLYAQQRATGLNDNFEKWINEEVETPAKPIFEKIHQDCSLEKEDMLPLSRYVLAQSLRTPAFILRNEKKWSTIAQSAINSTLEKLDRFFANYEPGMRLPKHASEIPEYYSPPVKVKRELEENGKIGFSIETTVGRATWLPTIRRITDKYAQLLSEYKWNIIKPSTGIIWPTSDDPVILLNYNSMNDYNFLGGIGSRHTCILFPASPFHLLFAEIGVRQPATSLNENPTYCNYFRRIILEHGFVNTYNKNRIKFMQEICPPLVSKAKWNMLRSTMQSWNDSQSEIEMDLFDE